MQENYKILVVDDDIRLRALLERKHLPPPAQPE